MHRKENHNVKQKMCNSGFYCSLGLGIYSVFSDMIGEFLKRQKCYKCELHKYLLLKAALDNRHPVGIEYLPSHDFLRFSPLFFPYKIFFILSSGFCYFQSPYCLAHLARDGLGEGVKGASNPVGARVDMSQKVILYLHPFFSLNICYTAL